MGLGISASSFTKQPLEALPPAPFKQLARTIERSAGHGQSSSGVSNSDDNFGRHGRQSTGTRLQRTEISEIWGCNVSINKKQFIWVVTQEPQPRTGNALVRGSATKLSVASCTFPILPLGVVQNCWNVRVQSLSYGSAFLSETHIDGRAASIVDNSMCSSEVDLNVQETVYTKNTNKQINTQIPNKNSSNLPSIAHPPHRIQQIH
jgi:hypothetical protein